MPVNPIAGAAVPGIGLPPTTGVTAGAAADGPGFGELLAQGIENLQGLQADADVLATQAATGDLTDVHDYMIAATKASLATELTVAVRNKAVEAFNEIMRMQV